MLADRWPGTTRVRGERATFGDRPAGTHRGRWLTAGRAGAGWSGQWATLGIPAGTHRGCWLTAGRAGACRASCSGIRPRRPAWHLSSERPRPSEPLDEIVRQPYILAMGTRDELGAADVSDAQLAAMVADLLHEDSVELLDSRVDPVDYDLPAITTGGRWWVSGHVATECARAPFRSSSSRCSRGSARRSSSSCPRSSARWPWPGCRGRPRRRSTAPTSPTGCPRG